MYLQIYQENGTYARAGFIVDFSINNIGTVDSSSQSLSNGAKAGIAVTVIILVLLATVTAAVFIL